MANGQNLTVDLAAVNYLLQLVDQMTKTRALISQQGGTTKTDFANLVSEFDAQHAVTMANIAALPDLPPTKLL